MSIAHRAAAAVATVHLPRMLKIGAGASQALPEILEKLGTSKPLIVTDRWMRNSGIMTPTLDALADARIRTTVFDGVVPDPTTDSLHAGVELAKANGCDVLVGFGGGSSMDAAKAIAVLARHGGPLRRFKVPAETPAGLPVVAVPTTAGTGSEVTRVSIVTDSETQEKMLCMGPGMLADAALVDFELSMGQPYRLTADSGLDTLCHALEAYVSKRASPFTDAMALASMRAVVDNLPQACAKPDDRRAREALMLAATQGGIAFSNSSVTLIHGMSRPIGAHFHVPHGLSNAILLPSITEWSIPGAEERYADCARALGYATVAQSDAEALGGLTRGLQDLVSALTVPTLAEFGVCRDEFMRLAPTMAEQALASGSPANNPRVPEKAQVVQLYGQLF